VKNPIVTSNIGVEKAMPLRQQIPAAEAAMATATATVAEKLKNVFISSFFHFSQAHPLLFPPYKAKHCAFRLDFHNFRKCFEGINFN
jgi:hypothetical protein